MENKSEKIVVKEIKGKSKLSSMVKKIIVLSVVFLTFSAILFLSIEFFLSGKKAIKTEMDNLNQNNENVLLEIKNIINKSIIAKNYIAKWEKDFTPSQKKLEGLEINDVQKIIQDVAIKNKIINMSVNFAPVIIVKGAFEKQNISTYTTLITTSFNAITDINVFNFIDDLKTELPGFIVIQEVNLVRTKRVDESFLKALETMNIATAINCDMKIRLYNLKQNN